MFYNSKKNIRVIEWIFWFPGVNREFYQRPWSSVTYGNGAIPIEYIIIIVIIEWIKYLIDSSVKKNSSEEFYGRNVHYLNEVQNMEAHALRAALPFCPVSLAVGMATSLRRKFTLPSRPSRSSCGNSAFFSASSHVLNVSSITSPFCSFLDTRSAAIPRLNDRTSGFTSEINWTGHTTAEIDLWLH